MQVQFFRLLQIYSPKKSLLSTRAILYSPEINFCSARDTHLELRNIFRFSARTTFPLFLSERGRSYICRRGVLHQVSQ